MRRCVLVVEDEPIIRMDTVSMLEEAGITVVEFDSADDALSYAQTHGQDIAAIFTDVNLRGDLDGVELAAIIARTRPEISVLVTSGRYDSPPEQLPSGTLFFKKPWLPLQVLSAMQDAVSTSSEA